ncbi:Flagellar hook-associated protein FlgL [Salipiger mucosus DSM 16094]|uniref:Flagellar hook-associated protein FlgL n=2 Tax=Salipiger mucosus TaxID=263378 RepID=S9QMH4_9RHOB|nr:Flagellar hook-associated protein FlgL [Salipiger mucosus DSM 16094]
MLVLRTNQTRLNRDLDRLGVEMATGFVRDSATHLGGDVSGLVAIDRTLAKLESYRVNTTEASFLTGTMQTTLDEIQERSEQLSQVLVSAELTPSEEMLRTLADEAETAMGQIVNGLNRSVGGRYLFSGIATDGPALADVDTILTDLRAALSGETTAAGVDAALDTWFDSPGGGFETAGYLGSTTSLAPLKLGEGETARLDIRADDQVFRDLLKSVAKAALATDDGLGFPDDLQIKLISDAASTLQGDQAEVVELRASLGALEARVEETATRNAAERTATSLARLELVGIDDYETAAKYENTRAQLESLYAISVRSSRMSLVEFLR